MHVIRQQRKLRLFFSPLNHRKNICSAIIILSLFPKFAQRVMAQRNNNLSSWLFRTEITLQVKDELSSNSNLFQFPFFYQRMRC